MTGFTEALGRRVLIGDGAMGTMLHAAGNALDRDLPELSLSDPKLVATIHESYVDAGVDVLETNTFGASRLRLSAHGHADKVAEINRAAVHIAREVRERSDREIFVAGAVSPAVTARQRPRTAAAERRDALREQIEVLVEEGVDLIVLETFGFLAELVEAVTVAAEVSATPLIAQATFAGDGRTLGGETPAEVAAALGDLPIVMLGTNCTIGPQRMLAVVEELVGYTALPVSAQPNAGQPRLVADRRFEFTIDGTYFARYVRRFAEAGVALVGGCCGTTPTHIRVAADAIADLAHVRHRLVTRPAPPPQPIPVRIGEEGLAGRLANRRFVVAAEVTPPVGGEPDTVAGLVETLRERGIGLFAVAAPESARAHLGSLNMALHLQQHSGMETMATVTTWDKTIMTLQADLLGAHALGMRSVICETGSPPVLGDYPAVDGIWEVDSVGLVALLAALNHGRDSAGLPLTTRTSFCVGGRVNPGADDLEAEISHARALIRAGAQFLVTRPMYDLDGLRRMAEALGGDDVPMLATIAPLRGFEEADYLAHEVPDVTIPADTLRALEQAGRRAERATGLRLAAELLTEARPLIDGAILAVPDDDPAALDPLLAAVT